MTIKDRIRGSLFGGAVGYDAIEQKRKEYLEFSDTILRTADMFFDWSI